MATIHAQAPDGATLNIDVPTGTDPSTYGSMVDDVVNHYMSTRQGGMESFGRAALNNFPLAKQAASALLPGDYSQNLSELSQKAAEGKEQHPIAYGAGAVTGAAAPLLIPGVGEAMEAAPVATNAALGAANAVSDTDLAKNPGQAVGQAALGAGIGGVTAGVVGALTPKIDVGAEAQRLAQNQALKASGAMRGQIGKLGVDESRNAAQQMLDQGIISPFETQRMMAEKVGNLAEQTGSDIGAARGAEGAAPDPASMIQLLQDQFGQKYSSGMHAGEAGTFQNVINEINQLGPNPTFEDWADLSTRLNHYASGANAFNQPANAATDAANAISKVNDDALQKSLSPEEFAKYEQDKQQFGFLKPVQEFVKRGEGREMSSRGGAGVGMTLFNKMYEGMAQKGVAQTANKIGKIGNALPTSNLATVTARLTSAMSTNPQSLGKFAAPLMQAAQSGGSQGLAAMHYQLSNQYPEYNEMMLKDQSE